MKCNEIEPLIYLVKEGELTPKEEADLHNHLSGCEHCTRLYKSVLHMTSLISQSRYSAEIDNHGDRTGDRVMRRIKPIRHRLYSGYEHYGRIILIKAVAASLLVFLSLTFAMQQVSFHNSLYAMQQRMHEALMISGEGSGDTDCVKELKKKLRTRNRSSFPQADDYVLNKISEEQLAQYISQVCGAGTADMTSIKKLLKQAGFSVNNSVN